MESRSQKRQKIEAAIRNGDANFAGSLNTFEEAKQASYYMQLRQSENNHKIQKLGSKEAVFKEQKAAIEHRNLSIVSDAIRKRTSDLRPKNQKIDPTLKNSVTTTTYERARKSRIKKFDAWFGLDKR